MQVPLTDVAALPAERRTAPQPTPERAAPPVPVVAPPVPPHKLQSDEELKALVAAAQKGKAELQKFVLELQGQIAERDGYIAELDGERREIARLREETRRAGERADKAEAAERETRKKLAEAEGLIVRLRAGGTLPASASVAMAPSADVAALQAELEKMKQKEADSRAEAWKALKQRADAEAAAAEVREDTVRKLKDARKLASVELTRATEEAMKKAVTLKEELTRTERERKELVAEVKRLGAELQSAQSAVESAKSAPPPAPSGDLGRVNALERELMNADAIAAADRAR
jgi:chromosome segregation ATPase